MHVAIWAFPGLPAGQDVLPGALDGLAVLGSARGALQRQGRSNMAAPGPEQRGAQWRMDRLTLWNALTSVAENGWTVERDGGEVVAQIGVRRRDADGLAGFVGQTRRQNATADSAGVHLLELQQRLMLLWRGGSGHRNNRSSQETTATTSSASIYLSRLSQRTV